MPAMMTPSELQELGKRYYGFKEYQKALDAFTEGIRTSSGPKIGLLDNRAAAFEKLENPKAALRDARTMINNDWQDVRVSRAPTSCGINLTAHCSKGYLRCAKILQQMQKPELALRIYRNGLRNVQVRDQGYRVSYPLLCE